MLSCVKGGECVCLTWGVRVRVKAFQGMWASGEEKGSLHVETLLASLQEVIARIT